YALFSEFEMPGRNFKRTIEDGVFNDDEALSCNFLNLARGTCLRHPCSGGCCLGTYTTTRASRDGKCAPPSAARGPQARGRGDFHHLFAALKRRSSTEHRRGRLCHMGIVARPPSRHAKRALPIPVCQN